MTGRPKTAFVTGITGQDGSYLAEFLLDREYEVHGLVRRSSSDNLVRLQPAKRHPEASSRLFLHTGNMTDGDRLFSLIQDIKPDEIYNLAAQSQVGKSFEIPIYTANVNGVGVLRLLEATRSANPDAKLFQASTSEMYGRCDGEKKTIDSPFHPISPYGISKLMAHRSAVSYREGYDLFICCGIMFNHESPRRSESFVTRKIVKGALQIKNEEKEVLRLGNLNARRDWGFAPEYVEAIWKMLQQEKPDDFVIATGTCFSVREFAEAVFGEVGFDIHWEGDREHERGVDSDSGRPLIKISENLYRPLDVPVLRGSPERAIEELNWKPRTGFNELVKIMVKAEKKRANRI